MIGYILLAFLVLMTSALIAGCASVDHVHPPAKCPEPLAYVPVEPAEPGSYCLGCCAALRGYYRKSG